MKDSTAMLTQEDHKVVVSVEICAQASSFSWEGLLSFSLLSLSFPREKKKKKLQLEWNNKMKILHVMIWLYDSIKTAFSCFFSIIIDWTDEIQN